MEERVKQIIAEIIGIELECIDEQTSPDNVPDWDSLKHMQIIIAEEGISWRIQRIYRKDALV